jgi:anthranilate phosphoribosyltransferase
VSGPPLADTITDLVAGRSLGAEGAGDALRTLVAGTCPPEQVAGFLVALAAKGPTTEELVGFLEAMTAIGVPLELPDGLHERCVDVVGTGGDRAGSVNVSTMAGLVVAACGVPVVKHGSRRSSSLVGAADLLEGLGVTLAPGPEVVARCVEEAGFGFCFAPAFHPALAVVAPVRAALGVRTVFNYLGPMANPAGVRHLLLGVSDPVLHDVMAVVVGERGVRRALVVRGEDGLDEVSVAGPTRVLVVTGDGRGGVTIAEERLDPTSHGLSTAPLDAIRGGELAHNVAVSRDVLGGADGPVRDVVALNAAAALVAAGRVDGVDEGLVLATEALASGDAAAVLARVVALSALS